MIDYEVRLLQKKDVTSVIELLNLVFQDWPDKDLSVTKKDHYYWKYFSRPENDNLNSMAVIDDKVIGCNHGFPAKIKMGSKTVRCTQATDFCVHPDFRRMGISKRISDLKTEVFEEKDYKYVYAITENQIVIDSNIKSGRKLFPFEFRELIRIKNIKKHLEMVDSRPSIIKEKGFELLRFSQSVKGLIFKSRSDKSGVEIKDINKFDYTVNDFYTRIKHSFNFILERDMNYLNWRYCDIRGGDFKVKLASENGEILGYIVTRINKYKPEYPTGWIIDLTVDPSRPEVAASLIEDALNFIDDEEVNVSRYWILKGHPLNRVFNDYGFADIGKKGPTVLFQLVKKGNEWDDFYNSSVDKLHLQMGDTEWL